MENFVKLCIVCILILMTIVGGAFAQTECTMEDIVQSNTAEQVLRHFQSVLLTTYDSRVEPSDFIIYVDADRWYFEDSVDNEIWTEDGVYSCYEGQYSGTLYFDSYLDEWQSYFQNLTMDPEGSLYEEIQSIEEEDGWLMVTTVPGAESAAQYLEQYEGGVAVTFVYRLDAKTLTLQSFVSIITYSDGSTQTILQTEYQYDVPLPDGAQALLDRLDDPQQLRTVTVTLHPDTEEELTRSAIMRKGESAQIVLDDPEAYSWYEDRECTQAYGGADKNEDLHVYLKRN